jgi:hypothetical protein
MLELGQEVVREMTENAISALLSADSECPLNTAIGDVDEFGVED